MRCDEMRCDAKGMIMEEKPMVLIYFNRGLLFNGGNGFPPVHLKSGSNPSGTSGRIVGYAANGNNHDLRTLTVHLIGILRIG